MGRLGRLRSSREFDRVYKTGKAYGDKLIGVRVAPRAGAETRVGFVVGKRLGKAVSRNRVRRRLRESVRAVGDGLAPGYDLIVGARPRAREAGFCELRKSLEELLKRAGVLGTTRVMGRRAEEAGASESVSKEARGGRTARQEG
ncbi:MAG: ribonuclease P protein component [Firmicutes bacterium]|nr:ribonuclease P protein component [Bacillota bacterium]